jgi:hypothetical protein
VNYYPEHMDQIAKLCRALNDFDDADPGDGMGLTLRNRIPVEDNDGVLFGHLVDEIGGAWSFEPVIGGES